MFFQSGVYQGCQPPTSSNIENWWERDDKWCHNDYGTWHHLWKKLHKKDVVGIVTFDLINWLTSHQPHYCLYYLQWHTGVCEEMFDVNSKITQTTQSIWKNFTVRKLSSTRNGKPWQLSARFQTLTWRLGEMVQNLESPGLSGRVDSPVYTVKPRFLDTCLIKTPHYYRQFALSLGKESP